MKLDVDRLREVGDRLRDRVIRTPAIPWPGTEIDGLLDGATTVWVKLELLQKTGSFKLRGALNVMLNLSEAERRAGITAVSAGNHAVATAYGAQQLGIDAKIVMLSRANALRVELCRRFGAELVFVDDAAAAFDRMHRIIEEEGRALVHPFEGPHTTYGAATVGAEFVEQAPGLEAVIVPIGGGGLASGVSAAVKELSPHCAVFGVEPVGADSMKRSLAEGRPVSLDSINTIADSLGAPGAEPISFATCQRYVDEVVTVEDDDLRRAMELIFRETKLAVEPACAASTAALVGPLRERLAGKRVGLIFCGSNIDRESFNTLLKGV